MNALQLLLIPLMVKPVERVHPQGVTTEARSCPWAPALVQFVPMNWKRMLAYVTGSVGEELLARNAYLVTENRILRSQIQGRIRLTEPRVLPHENQSLRWPNGRTGPSQAPDSAQLELHYLTEVKPELLFAWALSPTFVCGKSAWAVQAQNCW